MGGGYIQKSVVSSMCDTKIIGRQKKSIGNTCVVLELGPVCLFILHLQCH